VPWKFYASLTVLVVLGHLVTGCGEKDRGQTDVTGIVGTWIETREVVQRNPRFATLPPPTEDLRELTINADGTFEMHLVSASGEALLERGMMEGTWKNDNGYVVFEITKNEFPEDLKNIGPQGTAPPREVRADSGLIEVLEVFTEDESTATFKRKL